MAARDEAAGATRHDELIEIAKGAIGAEVGLSVVQSRGLVGSSADELRRDARAMAVGLGIEVDDHGGQQRDERGRFHGRSMNEAIRAAAGR